MNAYIVLMGIIILFVCIRNRDESYIYLKQIFPFLLLGGFALSNLLIAYNGDFVGYDGNIWDFGDFTYSSTHENNSIIRIYAEHDLYGTNYPPIAVLMFKVLNYLLPRNGELTKYASNYITTVIIIMLVYSLFALQRKIYNSSILLALSLVLSGPMLFALQRFNVTIIAFILTLVYVVYIESSSRKDRIIAIVSLIIAANIKLYPAVFGFMLIKRKRWKEAVGCIAGGIGLFITPAICLGIFNKKNPLVYMFHLSSGVTSFSNLYWDTTMSIQGIVARTFRFIGIENLNVIDISGRIFLVVYIIISLIVAYRSSKKYDELMQYALMCVFVPKVSSWYVLIYLLIPLLFLLSDNKWTVFDIAYYIVYVFLLCPYYGQCIFVVNSFGRLLCLWIIGIIKLFIPISIKRDRGEP